VLAVHGVGGATGTILVALLAGLGSGGTALTMSISSQLGVQIIGVVSVAVFSLVATVIIVMVTKAVLPFRATKEDEIEGLDFSHHGETAYRI
jgi:Amt family ammonium transporter